MRTRNKAVKASRKPHTRVEAGIRELRRFCRDLQRLVIVGCSERTDASATNQEFNTTTPEPWGAGMHSVSRTPSPQ